MNVGERHHHRLAHDSAGDQVGVRRRHMENGDVELVLVKRLDLLGRAHLLPHHRDAGHAAGDLAVELANLREDGRGDEACAQIAAAAFVRLLHDMAQPVGLHDQAPRFVEQGRAGAGQAHRALGAVEQGGPDLGLEILDVLRERRLGDRQSLGGAAEMQLLGDRQEAAKRAQVHR